MMVKGRVSSSHSEPTRVKLHPQRKAEHEPKPEPKPAEGYKDLIKCVLKRCHSG